MIEFIKVNKAVSVPLILSILFFLRKGIQYATLGSYVPILIIIMLIAILGACIQSRKKLFIRAVQVWAILLILWSLIRLLISTIHLTIQPFDGSLHLSQQFDALALVLSIVMMIMGITVLRNSTKKRIVDWG